MAALTAITPTLAGATSTAAAVAASDTIAAEQLGPFGAYLEIINAGAGTDTITISDASLTRAGNALTSGAVTGLTVANGGACKSFLLRPEQVNGTTGLITVTHSQPTGVTYKLTKNGV